MKKNKKRKFFVKDKQKKTKKKTNINITKLIMYLDKSIKI